MGITFSLTDTVNTFSCHILLLQLQGQTEHQPGDPADYGDTGSGKIHRCTAASVANYLAHSDAMANAHYRMRDCSTVVATANLLDSLVG